MNGGPADIYRARILCAVLDESLRKNYRVADPTALDRICTRLVESEEAVAILRNNGFGKPGMSIVELAKAACGKDEE